MKKVLKKVLAVVLCLTFIMSASVVAFAAKPADVKSDWGYDFQGVYRVKEGQIISVDIPRNVLEADESYIYVDNTSIAVKAENPVAEKISLVGVHYGATVLTFEAYYGYHEVEEDWYYDNCETYNYLVVVYDEADVEFTTGRLTNVTAYDETVTVGENGYVDAEYETEGDAQCYSLVYVDVDDAGYMDEDGYYETYNRGTIEGIVYFVDINGNYDFDSFTITAKYTPWQWVMHIIRVFIGFIFPWRGIIG